MPSPNPNRDSTPNPRGQSKVTGKEKTQTQIDRWIEPPVANAASYTDHGGAPYGVLDGMQALGDMPSAKVRGRVKGESVRKSVLGRTSTIDADATPGGSPALQPVDLPAPHTIVIDDEKDDDYAPKMNGGRRRERTTRNRGSMRVSQPASSVTPVPASAQALPPPPPPVMATPTPAPAPAVMEVPPVYPPDYDGDKLKRVVEAAKARAIQVGKPDLAAAVNEIYEQSKLDLNLRLLLQAILSQRASYEQNTQFQDYVRAAKKKLKDAKQRDRQQPPVSKATEAHPTPGAKALPTKLSLQSTPLLQASGASHALPSTEPAEPVKGKISLKVKSPAKHQHRRKPGKVMSVSPKKRSGSVGSDSSLTDLTSNDEDDGMDMDVDESDDLHRGPPPSHAEDRVNGIRDQAAERGSLAAPSGNAKRSSTEADLDELERDRVLAAKKQKLGESVRRDYDFQESSIRPALNAHKSRAQQVRSQALAPRLSLHASGSRTGSSRPSRAVSTDMDSPLSSPAGSRQSTPKVLKPAPKPFGKRAKTKQSPEKKQLGGVGSVALRESPVGDDDNEERSENNDFCSACKGSGYLLCCDGCDRSFHFTCLDPPLNANAKELDEPWYCFICVANRPPLLDSPAKVPTSNAIHIFAPLLNSLKRRNPRNFELPQELREYYEGVAADKNGSFIEALNHKPTRNRPGYSEEQPDYTKIRDGKSNLITCYHCAESSQSNTGANGPRRPLVACDHCGQHWHLDCLDPPLANPPALNQNGKKVYDWMCPLHADQEMRKVPMTVLNRKLHIRKPKKPKVVETALHRGHRNNGIIEILDDESDASDSEFYDQELEDGVVYKLPASGIKLDFIDKVKSTRIQQLRDQYAYDRLDRDRLMEMAPRPPGPLEQANFVDRPINEQQVALNLAQFATQNVDLGLGADQVQNLVGTLIAEAPPAVVDKMMISEQKRNRQIRAMLTPPPPSRKSKAHSAEASEETDALSADQRKDLLHLQELIRRRLEGIVT